MNEVKDIQKIIAQNEFTRVLSKYFSEYDNEFRSKQIKRGMAHKVFQGLSVTCPPLGYEKTATSGLFQPNELGLKMAEILQSLAKGSITRNDARKMLSKAIYISTGNQPSWDKITKLLFNPYYAGLIRWNGNFYHGRHQSLISVEQHQYLLDVFELPMEIGEYYLPYSKLNKRLTRYKLPLPEISVGN